MAAFSTYTFFAAYPSTSSLGLAATIVTLLPSIVQLVSLVALFGYISNRRLGIRSMWITCLSTLALAQLLRLLLGGDPAISLIVIVLLSPLFLANYFYSRHDNPIWSPLQST